MANIERKLSDTTVFNDFTLVNHDDSQYQTRERAKSTSSVKRGLLQPAGTLKYEVSSSDTIERVALKNNATPSEIMHLNRLASRTLYPGQILYVPDPDYVPPPTPPKPTTPAQPLLTPPPPTTPPHTSAFSSSPSKHFKWKPNEAPKPGHIEVIKRSNTVAADDPHKHHTPHQQQQQQHLRHTLSEDEAKKLDEECMQRFLKINSKIFTYNNGIQDGVLLVTPSAVMFDPINTNNDSNKKSEIIGCSSSNGGDVFSDESVNNNEMRQSMSKPQDDYESIIIPIEIISNVILYEDVALRDIHDYFELKRQEQQDAEETQNGDTTIEKSMVAEPPSSKTSKTENEINEILEELNAQQQREEQANSEKSKSIENLIGITQSSLTRSEVAGSAGSERRYSVTNIDSVLANEKNKLIRRLSTSVNSVNKSSSRSSSRASSHHSNDSVDRIEKKMNDALRRHSINNIQNSHYDDLLCYLCIKVNSHKDFISCPIDRKMKNRLLPEFWFQVPDNSTDKICAFFLAWKFDPTFALSPDTPRGRFQLVKDDSKSLNRGNQNTGSSINNDILMTSSAKLLSKQDSFVKDWEVVNLYELEQKLKVEKENEQLQLPNLIGESKILKEEHLRILNCNLIARAVSYDWVLTFSTEIHGFSLNTLYRTMTDIDSPCLLVVMDTNHNIFGAMTSCKLYPSEHFYGTGESFLYTFYPTFKVYKWTGDNNFFIKGDNQSLGIGCGDGAHGLWIDGDLYHGHTNKCKTYDNNILTQNEDFVVAAFEIWTFLD